MLASKWTTTFAFIIIILGLTFMLKKYYVGLLLNLTYNQFYGIKNLSFLSAYVSNFNWLVSQSIINLTTANPGSIFDSQLFLNEIFTKINALLFSYNFLPNLLTLKNTISLFEEMKQSDNCQLINNHTINCADQTSQTVLKNGLKAYMSYFSIIYQQIMARFTQYKNTSDPSFFLKLNSLEIAEFLSLQSLIFPCINQRIGARKYFD